MTFLELDEYVDKKLAKILGDCYKINVKVDPPKLIKSEFEDFVIVKNYQ